MLNACFYVFIIRLFSFPLSLSSLTRSDLLQMPKDASVKSKVCLFRACLSVILRCISLCVLPFCVFSLISSNAKPPLKRMSRVRVKRTQMRPSVLSPRTCSSARTGARGSKPRTPMLALVRVLGNKLHVMIIDLFLYLTRIGEVGKLLGAKWKELDDSEKKVRKRDSVAQCDANVLILYSPILNKLRATKRVLNKRKPTTMYVSSP